jgi:uncharacterized protein involved in exopolysaccharide biosynthesis
MSDPDQSSPPPVSEWPTANQGLTRRDVLNLLFKHLWVVLGTFLLVASIVWTGIAMLPATYVAKAKLLIRVEQQGTPSFMSGIAAYRDARDADPASRKLETEMGLLTARPLAEDVVSKLDIDYRSVYHPPYVHYLEPVSAFVAQIEGWWYGRPPAPSARGFTETVVAFGRALEVKGEVAKSADATPNILEVSLKAPDPRTAAAALDLLVRTYIGQGSTLDRTSGVEALTIVRRNLEAAQQRVAETDAQLRRVLTATGLSVSDVSAGGRGSVEGAKPAGPEGTKPSEGSTGSGDGNIVNVLRTQLAQAQLELSTIRGVYTDQSERVMQLRSTVAALERRVREESRRSADSQVRLRALLRQQTVAENAYLELTRKAEQIELFLQMEPTQLLNRQLLEAPVVPRTSEWRRSVVIGIAGSIAGLFLGLALAALREYFDHRFGSAAEAESYLGVPVLGALPDASARQCRDALAGAPAPEAAR